MINQFKRLKKEVENNLNVQINIFYLDTYGLYADIFKNNKKIISNFNIADAENNDADINQMLKEFLTDGIYIEVEDGLNE
jgi:hypothetical protein